MELGSRFQTMLPRLAVGAALVVCLAIVFDVGGVSRGSGRGVSQPETAPAFTSAPMAVSEREKDSGAPQSLAPGFDLSVFEAFEPQSSSAPREAGIGAYMQPHNAIAGIWAPDTSSCSLRDFRQGLLPTIINTDGAWAGETFCTFKNQTRTDNGLRVVATCASATEQWTTQVRLTINKSGKLTWASKRGTQTYTRCTPDLRMADVQ